MPPSLDQFAQQISASSLMSHDQLQALIAALPEGSQPQDCKSLARVLVQQKKLTTYQAQEIYAGRGQRLVLGNYVVLDKLGQGGMGMVLKAMHRRMKRPVALKILAPNVTQTPEALRRFQREVEAAAQLRHPNIVAADDADEADGVHFLVMEYVSGSDLAVLVKQQGPLPLAAALSCVLQAARGLEYAHQCGVVHRDIKPSNLLLDKKGTVKILDMGLARLDSAGADQDDLTGTGQIMGTVDYMAPEQALNTKHADARADIYALGVTLWYLLTGEPLYAGDSPMEKLMAHQTQAIPTLSNKCPDVTPALQAVFEKLVAKTPAARYQSMAEVLAALEACRGDAASSSSLSRSDGTDPQLQHFLRDVGSQVDSNAATVALQRQVDPSRATAAVDATVAFGQAPADTDPETQQSLTRPPAAQPQMELPHRQTRSDRGKKLPVKLFAAVAGGLAALILLCGIIIKITNKDGTQTTIEVPAGATVEVTQDGKVQAKVPAETKQPPAVNVAAPLSPLDKLDPAQIPATERFPWQPKELVAVIGEQRRKNIGPIYQVAYSGDGRWIASISRPGGLRLMKADTLEEKLVPEIVDNTDLVQGGVVFSADGKTLVATVQKAVVLWDVSAEDPVERARIPVNGLKVSMSGDGKKLAVLSTHPDFILSQWDLSGETPKELGQRFRLGNCNIVMSPDGKALVSAYKEDSGARLWDLTGELPVEKATLKHEAPALGIGLDFSPDNKTVLTMSNDVFRIWDVTQLPPAELAALGYGTINYGDNDMAKFSADGKTFAIGGGGQIYKWDGAKATPLIATPGENLGALALSQDGTMLVGGNYEGTVRIWDLRTDPPTERDPLLPAYGRDIAFSPDGAWLSTAIREKGIDAWNLTSAPPTRHSTNSMNSYGWFQGHVFTPDSKQLLTWDFTGTELKALGRDGFQQVALFEQPVSWSDGQNVISTLVARDQESQVKQWQLVGGELRHVKDLSAPRLGSDLLQVYGPTWCLSSQRVTYHRDKQVAVNLQLGGKIFLTDLKTGNGQVLAELPGGSSYCVTYSRDGKILAAGDGSGGILLWDSSSGPPKPLTILQAEAAPLHWLDFSPDGRWLAAKDMAGSVHVWNLASRERTHMWKLPGVPSRFNALPVRFAADSRHLATVNGNGTVYILRLASAPQVKPADVPVDVTEDPQRAAAIAILEAGGTVNVLTNNNGTGVSVSKIADLPAEPFYVNSFELTDRPGPFDKVCARLHELPGVDRFQIIRSTLAAENLAQLADLDPLHFSIMETRLADASADVIARWNRPNYISLNATGVGDTTCRALASLPSLRFLDLHANLMTDAGLAELAKCPLLDELGIGSCPAITAAGIAQVGSIPSLRRLHLPATNVGDEVVDVLAAAKQLRLISLYGTKVTDEGAKRLQQALPHAFIDHPATKAHPEEQELIRWVLSQESASMLDYSYAVIKDEKSDWTLLRTINLNGHHTAASEAVRLSTARCLTNLNWAHLKEADAAADHLGQLLNLDSLELMESDLTGAGLARLSPLTGLHTLNLNNCSGMNDEALAQLLRLPGLNSLLLVSCPLSGAGLQHLKQTPNLFYLWLNGTKITTDGLEHLASLAQLRELNLSVTPIDDDAVPHLSRCAGLRLLDLRGTKLTPEGIARLHAALPRCAIRSDAGLVVPVK